MNVLAELQKRTFEKHISREEYAKRRSDFLKLYYELRTKSESGLTGRMSLRTRKRLHPLIFLVFKIKNRLGGFSHSIIADRRGPSDRPVIYAVTHVGKFDIELVSEAIKDHYYLLSGDYEHIQGMIDEPFLNVNGIIYFNETVPEDRKAVRRRMVDLLKEGANLLYFPEGAWNLTPNLPLLPCYWGIVEIAQKGNAVVVPVAAEQYGKHFDINIGSNFDMHSYASDSHGKAQAIADLRDTLAALKWEIWEKHVAKRKEIPADEWHKYRETRFREWTYFSLDYVDTLVYRPKGITPPQEAFAYLERLIPCRENAFLLREKRCVKNRYETNDDKR